VTAFITSPKQDGSVRERVAQYRVAWDLFVSSPVVGVGLGHPFVWTRVDGTTWRDFNADTPLVLPAKLGVIGIAWLTLVAFVWVRFLRRLRKTAGITIPGLAMAGWAAVLVALAWTGFSLEDKGFSFALMFLLALALIEIEQATVSDEKRSCAVGLQSVAEPSAAVSTRHPIDR
jgi:O-antigen ligase